ncbi:hypothetical protein PHYSODRAFT_286595 [Phytophthora sojae]|uniref:Uncharacterized protein n=1 Tax=Phytophthora sojae (strain P6497) TaxID=1094619 RepID=G4ZU88_PHYSP|nr:hypothetical protein PHYSODRAFT_286595 [Phytophthora sojae]EGZ13362.1 hypothetical protein PHYSODRAFT_286595 [Phytophthora sojae]|eukprot:XP_009530791.1 hypothetical protein PHYSODRAFT_286595 [Phytophthora sojae]
MVLVSTDTFLAKVAEFYAEAQGSKGSVAISCKSGASCYSSATLVPCNALTCCCGDMMDAVPVAKVNSKAQQQIHKLTVEDGDNALLFRACQYGNNKHKKKYSTVVRTDCAEGMDGYVCSSPRLTRLVLQVTAVNHASFHASLNQIVKTKVDALAKDVLGKGAKRVVAKVKKTTE